MDHHFSLLLIEPETQQQQLIKDVLRSEFKITHVTTSTSSLDAMNHLTSAKENIQCIIVSSTLEDISGFSLIKNIRTIKKYTKTPIMVISDTQERNHIFKAASSGASDFIVKPLNTRSLALKLKKLLASKHFRTAERVSTLDAFDVKISFNKKNTYECKLVDISTGGCSIKSPPFHGDGSIFDKAEIQIIDTPLTIMSELIRMEKDPESEDQEQKLQIAGFQFIDVDKISSTAISNFIESLGA